jgi:PPP family 3-phenylpropionic acid transporter
MFLITGVFGFLQPFTPIYLKAAGLPLKQIGLVTALGTAAVLLIQPVLGRLSDRLDTRRPFMVVGALMAATAYELFRYANGFLAFVLLTALGINGYQYLNAVGAVLVGRMAQVLGGGTAYVRFRLWGSVGYVLIAMTTGILVRNALPQNVAPGRADLAPIFLYGPLLFILIAVVAFFVPDVRAAKPPQTGTGAADQRPFGLTIAEERNLRWFLAAYFLYQFSLYGASAYLSLFMQKLGADTFSISAMFAGGVVVEVLMMTQVGRWVDKYGRRPVLAISFMLLPLRLLLYVPAHNPIQVMLVQTLHGVNFGIMGTIAIVYINDLAQNHERGAMQARLAATGGLATALGPLICGYLSDWYGIPSMFAAMSGIGLAGAIVFLKNVRETHPEPAALPSPLRFLAGASMEAPSGNR